MRPLRTVRFLPGLKVRYIGPENDKVKPNQVLTVKKLEASYGKASGMWFTFVSFEETDQELSLIVLKPAFKQAK